MKGRVYRGQKKDVIDQYGLFLSLIRMLPVLVLYLSQYTGDNTSDIEMNKDEFKDLIVQETVGHHAIDNGVVEILMSRPLR